jgi:streptomycin 6-kinase
LKFKVDSIHRHLSTDFSERIVHAFGPAGVQWLRQLPQILKDASERWLLRLQPPFQPLSYHLVVPATSAEGEPVVLKAGVPNREFKCEIDALHHFDGQVMVQLLKADRDTGLMLLERIRPGDPLAAMKDDECATSVFAGVVRRMRKAAPTESNFPSIVDWAKGFQRLRDRFSGNAGPFPESVVNRADTLMAELIDSMSDAVLLHGDLHHWNILSAEREPWLCVDPQGVVGEQEYEIGAWLRNPFPDILKITDPKEFLARRVDQLSEELGFDRNRIIGWAYSQAVLAGVWSFEEGSDDSAGWLTWANEIGALL